MHSPVALEGLPLDSFEAGEVLIHENSERGALFFLVSGTVEVSKQGQLITRVREPGAMFGEMSVLLKCKHTATVTAIDRVDCRVVEDPDEYLALHPEVTLYVCRILARRLDSLNKYLVDIKEQFADRADHLGMVDEVLGAIMNRKPRDITPPADPGH